MQHILINSRKQSTRRCYDLKWTRLIRWICEKHIDLPLASIQDILEYLLHLKLSGLSISSLKVHLTAIMAHHILIDNRPILAHSIVKKCMKGLVNMYPAIKDPVPTWDLNLVLMNVMKPPLESMATCSMFHLSVKTAFIIAIMSARQVIKLYVLKLDLPFTIFHKVMLCPNAKFFPKGDCLIN